MGTDGHAAYQHVDFPQRADAIVHHVPNTLRVGYVAQDRVRIGAQLPALGGHRLQLRPAGPGVQNQVRPLAGEGQGHLPRNVAAGPGNHGGLPLQAHRVSPDGRGWRG